MILFDEEKLNRMNDLKFYVQTIYLLFSSEITRMKQAAGRSGEGDDELQVVPVESTSEFIRTWIFPMRNYS